MGAPVLSFFATARDRAGQSGRPLHPRAFFDSHANAADVAEEPQHNRRFGLPRFHRSGRPSQWVSPASAGWSSNVNVGELRQRPIRHQSLQAPFSKGRQ